MVALLDCYNVACFLDIRNRRSNLGDCSVAFPLNTCFLECLGRAHTAPKADGIAYAVGKTAQRWVQLAARNSDCTPDAIGDTYFAVVAVADPCD